MIYSLTVTTPQTLLPFLREKCPLSGKALKRAIDAKQCKINGRVEFFSTHPLKVGDRIELKLKERPAPARAEILYEDEALVIINKPAFVESVAPAGLHLVHRLDKETSGALLLAKNKQVLESLIALFAERKVEKRYLAIADAPFEMTEWQIDNFLVQKGGYQGGTLWGSAPNGKRAITRFRVLKRGESCALVQCMPVTGRTHQIRVHLFEMGHPILGDWQYARRFCSTYDAPRVLLHAEEIAFPHPITQVPLRVRAPIPKDLEACVSSL